MVPPVPEDEFDFDKMTPEEQLAWLESLARRQGARDEELTTAADQDIPIPENVEIDEPGYVPYSILHDGPVPVHTATPEAVPWDEYPDAGRDEDDEKAETGEGFWAADSGEEQTGDGALEDYRQETAVSAAADPMRWLGGLAVRSDEDTVVHVRADEGAGFDWGAQDSETVPEEALSAGEEGLGASAIDDAWEEVTRTAERRPEVPADFRLRTEAAEDFLDGVDPMLWLESLAARQGARSEELVTPADLSIAEPPPDVVIDEPGYVPFEASRMSLGLVRGSFDDEVDQIVGGDLSDAVVAEGEGDSWGDFPGEDRAQFEALELVPGDEDAASLAEASTWLESLDREHQDEPEETLAPAESAPDALLWLEDLATEPESDLSEFLAVDDGEAGVLQGLASPDADPLAGMTDEQIEQALVRGELSGEQELAWLQRQASRLAVERESQEDTEFDEAASEPASPAEDLPAWIVDMRPIEMGSLEAEEAASLDLESPQSEGAPWLTDMDEPEEVAESAAREASALTLAGDLETVGGVDEPETVSDELRVDWSGLDNLGEAVEETYEDEPAQYGHQAMETSWDVGLEAPVVDADVREPEAGGEQGEPQFQLATPVEMPAWLLSEDETPGFDEADVPAWLRDASDQEARVAADDQTWLAAHEAEAGSGWLGEFDRPAIGVTAWEESAPLREMAPAATRRASLPVPDSEQLAEYERRVAENSDDHGSRIALARALWALDQVPGSCAHYEVLIEAGQLLPDVVNDLSALVVEYPAETQIHRMLGDAYLRRGRLKEALYSYRRALEQL